MCKVLEGSGVPESVSEHVCHDGREAVSGREVGVESGVLPVHHSRHDDSLHILRTNLTHQVHFRFPKNLRYKVVEQLKIGLHPSMYQLYFYEMSTSETIFGSAKTNFALLKISLKSKLQFGKLNN